jgi:four helix bundle protein
MTIKSFEDLLAWQKAQDMAVLVYINFGSSKDFGFRDQICRASVSVSNNIAEGFDRYSKREFARFLYIAKGSCAEVKSMLYLAKRLRLLDEDKAKDIQGLCEETSKIIRGLIKSLTENDNQ